jgi:hypothetical protein
MATVQIEAQIDSDGRIYPVGSDTPLPTDAVRMIEYHKSALSIGDAIVDATGELWLVTEDDGWDLPTTTLLLRSAQHPAIQKSFNGLHTPAIRVYHNGEPRHDFFA